MPRTIHARPSAARRPLRAGALVALAALVALITLLALRPAIATAAAGPSSRPAAPPAEWVLVTAPAFRDAVEPLRRHRTDEGLRVTLLLTTDVLGPEDIRRGDGTKLRRRLNELCRHNREAGGKTYILLVGLSRAAPGAPGAREDESEKTVVPALSGTAGRMKGQPTDNGYGCLGDGLLPEVAVGRLPARTADEARRMVEKTLAYEQDGRRAPWRRDITLLVGNPGGQSAAEKALGNWYVGHVCQSTSERINPLYRLRAVYHIPGSPWYVPDARLRDESLRSLKQGQALVAYLGHSGPEGFWSDGAPFLDRDDWAKLDVPHGAGVFITCGCFSCQLDPAGNAQRDGYGLAAVRNAAGPAAVVGATGESYAAMGQLAFTGLLGDLAGPALPERLGDAWLDLKAGLAKGPMDFFTFKMFDYADGSNGTVPLSAQRQEHLEMWTLLGDPAMRLPVIAPEITLEAPGPAEPGAKITVRGSLPGTRASAGTARVRVTVERLPGSAPQASGAGNANAGYQKANDPVLVATEVNTRDGRFEVPVELPKDLPWPRVVLRASTGEGPSEAVGVAVVKVERSAESK